MCHRAPPPTSPTCRAIVQVMTRGRQVHTDADVLHALSVCVSASQTMRAEPLVKEVLARKLGGANTEGGRLLQALKKLG